MLLTKLYMFLGTMWLNCHNASSFLPEVGTVRIICLLTYVLTDLNPSQHGVFGCVAEWKVF